MPPWILFKECYVKVELGRGLWETTFIDFMVQIKISYSKDLKSVDCNFWVFLGFVLIKVAYNDICTVERQLLSVSFQQYFLLF